MKQLHILAVVILHFMISGLMITTSVNGATPDVLILNAYHQGEDWSDNQLSGILPTLKEAYPFLVPSIEHMDTKRFSSTSHLSFMKDYLKRKYSGRRFDLIMALDNSALDLMLNYRGELFPGVPIVFSGVNGYGPDMLRNHKKITGVAEVQDMAGTIQMALKLQPGTKTILSIHDYTSSGFAVRKDMEAAATLIEAKVEFKYTPKGTVEDLTSQLKTLSSGTVVILLTYVTDSTGRTLTREESTRLITRSSPVPVYAMHETRLGYGILGGLLLEGSEHGRQAAELAVRVLNGENISQIPVEKSMSRLILDYQSLKRFKIPQNRWPNEAIIVYRPISFWQQNRIVLVPLLVIICVLLTATMLLSIFVWKIRKAETTAREAAKFSKEIIDSVKEGVIVYDRQLRYQVWNPFMEQFSGYSSRDVIGHHPLEFFPWLKEAGMMERLEKTLAGESLGVIDFPFSMPEVNREGWASDESAPLRNARGEIIGVIATVRDITERKLAEDALKKSSFIIDSTTDAVVTTDVDGNITFWNKGAENLYGYRVEEVLGGPISIIYKDEDLHILEDMIAKLMNGESIPTIEVTCIDKDQRDVEILLALTTIKGENNNVIELVGFTKDITERIKAEKEVQAALNEKETLLQEIHHRVKNNLQIVASLLKLQADQVDDVQVKEALKESQGRVYTMSAVHESLYKSENLSDINLKSYLTKITKTLLHTYQTGPGKVRLDINSEDIRLNIEKANPLGLIINELISNTLKYAFPDNTKGEINISARMEDDDLELIVSDDGVGMPPAFDWKNANTLGLQMVMTLVENQLSGSITMESNKGTTFTIRLKTDDN